ncbi:hypothetical protein GCM10011583_53100 [Streptomyces camponoticapitis]|uniref:Uncharacterized protein n=1 Tax=Streptomyces camponoticapitis TaxID=1616125 RepID=A0ABQ2EJI3_9ACTN|nr:hypothetical protein GCM10011583_53100 [Streptomyces camponoticapitis]
MAPAPRRNPDGSVTVPTLDAGDVRLSCPPWCVFQHGYVDPPAKTDIVHRGEPVWALADVPEHGPVSMVEVGLVQWPYSDRADVYLEITTDDGQLECGPAGSRAVAAALQQHAGHILAMVGQLEEIRGAGR